MNRRLIPVVLALALALLTTPVRGSVVVHQATRAGEPEQRDSQALDSAWDHALVQEATSHFREGQRLFDAGRYLRAAVEFERSHAAIRAGETLYNIALSYERGGRPADALIAANRYLELPSCAQGVQRLLCANKRAEVERTVLRLREQVAELAIELEPGVELRGIRVDDRILPVGDFPVLLDPGAIEIEVLGQQSDERKLRVLRLKPGETTLVHIEPFERTQAQTREPPKPDIQPSLGQRAESKRGAGELARTRLKRGFWAGVGITAASTISVSVLGGLTILYQRRYSEALCRGMCLDPQATHPWPERERFQQLKTATNVMVGITAGAAALTLALGIAGFWPGERKQRRARITPGRGGIAVRF